MMSPIEA